VSTSRHKFQLGTRARPAKPASFAGFRHLWANFLGEDRSATTTSLVFPFVRSLRVRKQNKRIAPGRIGTALVIHVQPGWRPWRRLNPCLVVSAPRAVCLVRAEQVVTRLGAFGQTVHLRTAGSDSQSSNCICQIQPPQSLLSRHRSRRVPVPKSAQFSRPL
jgi:hypothetical protein